MRHAITAKLALATAGALADRGGMPTGSPQIARRGGGTHPDPSEHDRAASRAAPQQRRQTR